MPEKKKPKPKIVTAATKALKDVTDTTIKQVKSIAVQILDDHKSDPEPHESGSKPAAKKSAKKTPAKKTPAKKTTVKKTAKKTPAKKAAKKKK